MKLLDMCKSSSSAPTYDIAITLDLLWERASALGRISIDDMWDKGTYTVEIRFDRKSGSTINAKGKHTDIREAFRLAIEEALALGATP